MEKLRQHFSRIKIPQPSDAVYKDECMYSFDSPDSITGLYVCLNTFLGFGRKYVLDYSNKSGNCVFLHRTRTRREVPSEKEAEPDKKIARLAIGVEGGFNPDVGAKKYEYSTTLAVVILPDFEVITLPNDDLPQLVLESVLGVEKAEGALQQAAANCGGGSWDGEVRQISRHADSIQQLDNGVKVPPKGWQCSQCDLTDNLWMNLTDGAIHCGRRQLDGSGGNNHAVEHYDQTKYPLAVKLGTITADGKADVYSYAEDDMVIDPHLVKHLAHFGINVSVMEKTEKTMAELEIDFNQRVWEYSRLTESGQKLVPMFGPGYTGLRNLGNSCYVNSVMQVLLTVPPLAERYYISGPERLAAVEPKRIPQDFDAQMAKLAIGLLSGEYSKAPADYDPSSAAEVDIDELQPGIAPGFFRSVVGSQHPEFSTKKQQDAMEYLEHVLKLMERSSLKAGLPDPGHCFRFGVEDKFVCSASGCVRYVERSDLYLPLPVPLEAATNKLQVQEYNQRKLDAEKLGNRFTEDAVRSSIPYEACISKMVAPEVLTAYSSAAKASVPMTKTTRITTCPDYLFIQLVKFDVTETWEPVKLDVSVRMPDTLHLSVLRSAGRPEGEKTLPDDSADQPTPAAAPVIDEAVVKQLCDMGFPVEACKKAVHFTGNCGADAAMNWIMEHMNDPDFSLPLVTSTQSTGDSFTASAEGLMMLESMGFTEPQARLALRETQNNLERAADWLFSHQPELEQLVARHEQGAAAAAALPTHAHMPNFTDGSSKYELVAFISHMGTSIHVGHYVCHIKKDGQWTIFNDNKVSKSVDPPIDLGYLYLYKRAAS
ncbi:ubiquitin carboxyl-terminal hydrolase 5 isoform X2 [Hyalella azteca]|uniref:Ubiquitin carboxyl-terminal hydrolase n=1 Tax=Hyalella azteca TaxID=294128 RepID=A0A8B7NW52_HYAAZ|nr:ubiquitin carboxyl-terminal hydrolase 5 isoform X2 [Hyalella azteca]